MRLTDEQIADLKIVLEAAREYLRMESPDDMVTMAAIAELERVVEEHENS